MNLSLRPAATATALLLLLLGLAGCRTPIDWNTRVGSYTYDQAVVELGPPDKYAKITDGTIVAEWLTYRGGTSRVYSSGYGYWGGPYPYHPPTIIVDDYPSYESFLRLIFAPDGTLKSFKKYTR